MFHVEETNQPAPLYNDLAAKGEAGWGLVPLHRLTRG